MPSSIRVIEVLRNNSLLFSIEINNFCSAQKLNLLALVFPQTDVLTSIQRDLFNITLINISSNQLEIPKSPLVAPFLAQTTTVTTRTRQTYEIWGEWMPLDYLIENELREKRTSWMQILNGSTFRVMYLIFISRWYYSSSINNGFAIFCTNCRQKWRAREECGVSVIGNRNL